MLRIAAAAIKALELDDTLGEAHNSLAFVRDSFDWDFDSAGKQFQRAIEPGPGNAPNGAALCYRNNSEAGPSRA
jgi:hypothetical protein